MIEMFVDETRELTDLEMLMEEERREVMDASVLMGRVSQISNGSGTVHENCH